jgi:hypothetical protein
MLETLYTELMLPNHYSCCLTVFPLEFAPFILNKNKMSISHQDLLHMLTVGSIGNQDQFYNI